MFEENSFYKTVSNDSIKLLSREKDKIHKLLFKQITNQPREQLMVPYSDYYVIKVMKLMLKIESLMVRCNVCINKIKKLRSKHYTPKSKNKALNDKLEDVNIFLSNYYISINTIYEVILKLINAVIFTGIDDRDVNQKIIFSNFFINNTKIPEGLKLMQKQLQQISKRRNEIIHEFCDDYLYDTINPEVVKTVKLMRIENVRILDEKLYHLSEHALSLELYKLVIILKKNMKNIKEPINIIYNSLEDIYLKNPYRKKI